MEGRSSAAPATATERARSCPARVPRATRVATRPPAPRATAAWTEGELRANGSPTAYAWAGAVGRVCPPLRTRTSMNRCRAAFLASAFASLTLLFAIVGCGGGVSLHAPELVDDGGIGVGAVHSSRMSPGGSVGSRELRVRAHRLHDQPGQARVLGAMPERHGPRDRERRVRVRRLPSRARRTCGCEPRRDRDSTRRW